MLPSRCASHIISKASPTGPKCSRQVRSEPACIPATGCTKPGVASVQAVELNSEICMVVVHKDTLFSREERKPTRWIERKAAVLSRAMASEIGHHRGLRAGHVRTGVTRELERACSLPCTTLPDEGCRSTHSPGADMRLPMSASLERGYTNQGKTTGYRGASDERSHPGRGAGSLSHAQYR